MTTVEVNSSRDNCFDLLRTMAALAVLYSHSFALSGLPEPLTGNNTTLGSFAVWVFFAISGYLITQSGLASVTVKSFATKRLLRIMPALIVLLVLSVFVAGPMLTNHSIGDYFANIYTWTYLIKNPAFGNQGELPGVFMGVPFSGEFNGSLWTIKYELLMYALVGVGMALRRRNYSLLISVILATTFFAMTLLHQLQLTNLSVIFWRLEGFTALKMERVSLLGCLFFCGSVLAFGYPKRNYGIYVAASTAFIFAYRDTALFKPFAALLLPLVVIYLAHQGAYFVRALKPRLDLSYGIYLYAFPIQQAIASIGFTGQQYWPLTLTISLLATVGLAYISWMLIEQPALGLKNRFNSSYVKPST